MNIENMPILILEVFVGMFLYGIRNMVGKWMVQNLFIKPMKKILIRTEKHLAYYLHKRNIAYLQQKKKSKR